MAYSGLKVLDSDMHCMEPPDLWGRYIDDAYKPFAPRGLQEYIADLRIVIDGKTLPRHSSLRARSRQGDEDPFFKRRERFRSAAERGWDGKAQLEAMDTEGIDVAVVYPSRGLFALAIDDLDPAFAAAIARAYNDWLHDYCKPDPTRLLGAGMISPHDVRDAVEEARRAVEELGFRAVFMRPNPVKGRNWHDDPYFEPLWAELERLQVPLGFHEGFGPYLPQVGDRFGADLQMVHTACQSFMKLPISDESKRKILWDNCARYYGIAKR